ncbi:MAG: putative selenate reductase subunit YgfK [Ignavibacterium sp.]|nr:MAG: putative selenate reductase subunit YgfK [Ignavibacterium sp.]
MSDRFYRIPIDRLYKWITAEEEHSRIFGLYKELLFIPDKDDPFKMDRYGITLDTPIGVAAGPHTQLAHNIIASWLCGGSYLELKTVQTLDEIEVTKPCIDMEDEGYNCEWSQELKVHDSYDEYLNAWILIHVLKHKYKWDLDNPGFIFNLSVGYDLKGILNDNVQWFFDKMSDASIELEEKIKSLKLLYPAIEEINIPSCLSDNITLSTMHGCPPDEIERIGKYLIEERKLHTAIKLNPTLLGPDELRYLLNKRLGYEINIPDEAFEHDLKYPEALGMINSLSKLSEENGVEFALKLTNTLESSNSTHWLPEKEKMVYTSGRALHSLTINLAKKLQTDFDGKLDLSFSGGVDAFNVAETLACNLKPITVCSDLLKPGGYLRLPQYLDELRKHFSIVNADSIDEFISKKSNGIKNINQAGLHNINEYCDKVVENKYYHKSNFPFENIKTPRELTEYDCVHAPCIEACAVDQNVPDYMYYTAKGDLDKAFEVVIQDNPQPNITGNVCDHLCQPKCTRINYDNPLLIRGIKRYISENYKNASHKTPKPKNRLRAAIIGAGPSGLSCAYFLALEGFEVNIYESKSIAGGMASGTIPSFRLSDEQIKDDIDLIKSIGVNLHFNHEVDKESFKELQSKNDYIYLSVGAKDSKKLQIPGEDFFGVYDQLSFLFKVRSGKSFQLGSNVAIIGGGLSAVDAARTSQRLIDSSGKVTMVYRRTKKEMPVGADEIKALLDEGVELYELTAPISISKSSNNNLSLECIKMELGQEDESGRRRPIPIDRSEFNLNFDSIITAIGQDIVVDFIPDEKLIINKETNETQYKNVFAGGDALRGADSLINAIGDGKKVAEIIIKRALENHKQEVVETSEKISLMEFQKKQAYREFGIELPETDLTDRQNFNLVNPTLTDEEARREAERCMFCNDVCNICVGVCPNFSNLSFTAVPEDIPVYRVTKNGNENSIEVFNHLRINQDVQIINIADFCNECGNCNTFCPTSGAPYLTKPRFYLTEESFSKEEFGFLLQENSLMYKNAEDGSIEILRMMDDKLIYESDKVKVEFEQDNFLLLNAKFKSDTVKNITLEKAAEMYFLLFNLRTESVFQL